jgi:hypothetical protein
MVLPFDNLDIEIKKLISQIYNEPIPITAMITPNELIKVLLEINKYNKWIIKVNDSYNKNIKIQYKKNKNYNFKEHSPSIDIIVNYNSQLLNSNIFHFSFHYDENNFNKGLSHLTNNTTKSELFLMYDINELKNNPFKIINMSNKIINNIINNFKIKKMNKDQNIYIKYLNNDLNILNNSDNNWTIDTEIIYDINNKKYMIYKYKYINTEKQIIINNIPLYIYEQQIDSTIDLFADIDEFLNLLWQNIKLPINSFNKNSYYVGESIFYDLIYIYNNINKKNNDNYTNLKYLINKEDHISHLANSNLYEKCIKPLNSPCYEAKYMQFLLNNDIISLKTTIYSYHLIIKIYFHYLIHNIDKLNNDLIIQKKEIINFLKYIYMNYDEKNHINIKKIILKYICKNLNDIFDLKCKETYNFVELTDNILYDNIFTNITDNIYKLSNTKCKELFRNIMINFNKDFIIDNLDDKNNEIKDLTKKLEIEKDINLSIQEELKISNENIKLYEFNNKNNIENIKVLKEKIQKYEMIIEELKQQNKKFNNDKNELMPESKQTFKRKYIDNYYQKYMKYKTKYIQLREK